MERRIYLVRHGLTQWNEQGKLQGRLSGIFLSEKGKQQVAQTAEALREAKIDRIITSPLERTVETGEIINKYHGVPLDTDERFSEWQMDSWQGFLFADLETHFPEQFTKWRADPSVEVDFGGESLAVVADRCYEGLDFWISKYSSQNLLVVSHGDPLRALVATVVGIPLSNIRRFEMTNAGITTLVVSDGQMILESLNILP